MEKELNIAEILKDKPKGLKLFDRAKGVPVLFKNVNTCNLVICETNKSYNFAYNKYGKYAESSINAINVLVPSRTMRDWSKFAWKKGDVLVSNYFKCLVIFSRWTNDEYTEFEAAYLVYQGDIFEDNVECTTDEFSKTSEENIKECIKKVEKHHNGKLNLETLEIEKPEFKDGDILTLSDGTIFINKDIDDCEPYCYAILYTSGLLSIGGKPCSGYSGTFARAKFATDEEKQQLFDALAKKGKRWNAETKTLEDLPKKCEFKPFDKVLVKHEVEYEWMIDFFSHYDKDDEMPFVCMTGRAVKCIPYNDKTAHLLGTTDDWKGGEEC